MGKHLDDMRAYDQPYIRTSVVWAYGERAAIISEVKFYAMLEEASLENSVWHPFI